MLGDVDDLGVHEYAAEPKAPDHDELDESAEQLEDDLDADDEDDDEDDDEVGGTGEMDDTGEIPVIDADEYEDDEDEAPGNPPSSPSRSPTRSPNRRAPNPRGAEPEPEPEPSQIRTRAAYAAREDHAAAQAPHPARQVGRISSQLRPAALRSRRSSLGNAKISDSSALCTACASG